jgi:hypothetical protein
MISYVIFQVYDDMSYNIIFLVSFSHVSGIYKKYDILMSPNIICDIIIVVSYLSYDILYDWTYIMKLYMIL